MVAAIRTALGLAMLLGFAPQESRPHQDAASRKAVAKFTVRGTALDQHGNPYRGHVFLTPQDSRSITTTGGKYLTQRDRQLCCALSLTDEKGQFQLSDVQAGDYLLGPCVGFDEELDVARFGYPITVVDRDAQTSLRVHRGPYAKGRLLLDELVSLERPELTLWSPETGYIEALLQGAEFTMGPLVPSTYEARAYSGPWRRGRTDSPPVTFIIPGPTVEIPIPAPVRVTFQLLNLQKHCRFESVEWTAQDRNERIHGGGSSHSDSEQPGTSHSVYLRAGTYIAVATDDRGYAAVSERFHLAAGSGTAEIRLPLAPAGDLRCVTAPSVLAAEVRILRGEDILLQEWLGSGGDWTFHLPRGPVRIEGTVWIANEGPGCKLLPLQPQDVQIVVGGTITVEVKPKRE